MIAILMGIMVSVIVGVALLPALMSMTDSLPPDTPAGLKAMVEVLPYVLFAIILLGFISWLGHDSLGDSRRERKELDRREKEAKWSIKENTKQLEKIARQLEAEDPIKQSLKEEPSLEKTKESKKSKRTMGRYG